MKTTYKVLWGSFQGHAEGDTFEAEIDEALERRAVDRGQIRVMKRPNKKKEEEKADG